MYLGIRCIRGFSELIDEYVPVLFQAYLLNDGICLKLCRFTTATHSFHGKKTFLANFQYLPRSITLVIVTTCPSYLSYKSA